MDNLRKLEELFSHFPGIGPRQARRFVYYLLNKSPASIKELTDLISEVKKSSIECSQCHRFYARSSNASHTHIAPGESSDSNISSASAICPICSDASRDRSTLMIVARDSDFESIEKSGAYNGLYFILGGAVPVLDHEPEKRIRLEKLLQRLSQDVPFKEIILSLNTTPDGEHTANIVRTAIQKITDKPSFAGLKLTILGRGLSTGAELEYVDGETIKNALRNRR